MKPLSSTELIGSVAFLFLKDALSTDDSDGGVARFMLDCLTGEQVAEICRRVLADTSLLKNLDIKVPASLVSGFDLPSAILTDEPTGFWRHAHCDKPARLLASAKDNEKDTLREVVPLGAKELKGAHQYWVEIAAQGLPLNPDNRQWWRQALKGLQIASDFSLEHFARYVAATRQYIVEAEVPVVVALGWALPELRLPRDSGYFEAIEENKRGQANKWQSLFQTAISKYGCYLLKETPTRRLIESDELRDAFKRVKDDIPQERHEIVERFIDSQPGWNDAAKALAHLEWRADNIHTLFTGLRTRRVSLAAETKQFFADVFPESLTEEDSHYLETLVDRQALEPDKQFYEAHRHELEYKPPLKAKWDKFVYGQHIECTDFLVGLVAAIERLFDRAREDGVISKKRLSIGTLKTQARSKWLELNPDVGLFFCTRYRGLMELTSPEIAWETHWLFRFDQLVKEERVKEKPKLTESKARAATEIRFSLELEYQTRAGTNSQTTQLIWRGNPEAIGSQLYNDLESLQQHPFLLTHVYRNPVSRKGRIQDISLSDINTLKAADQRDHVSLVSAYDPEHDLAHIIPIRIREGVESQRLTEEQARTLEADWADFSQRYRIAIQDLAVGDGVRCESLLQQAEAWQRLFETLLENVQGDINRRNLYMPLLQLGCVQVRANKPTAIIPPWHPLRMAAMAIKSRRVAGLIRHLLKAEDVEFGDIKLFFADLKNVLLHPWYPEVCVGLIGQEPKLLTAADTLNDYSLMERPIRDETENNTNEDPTDAAEALISLVNRYLALLPHERTNLTLVLYNCDSTHLPRLVVKKLAAMGDEHEEVRCQVTLRHQDPEKLSRLYQEMIEAYDADSEIFVASELAQDYLARLRLGVMAEQARIPDAREGRPADMVFLQDVVSRQAQEIWLRLMTSAQRPALLSHVPAGWSRKRPAIAGELRSTAYLVCPQQPLSSGIYIEALYCLINGENYQPECHHLPARQISFQKDRTREIFDEVHRLGEWVVNYDGLLEKRQLLNQGLKVIRHKHAQSNGRNLLVSSATSLKLLHVLVRNRLRELDLGLAEEELDNLTKRFIDEANEVSGDIVLRAAKNGRFASELIGVVLSKRLLAGEMGQTHPVGWYFLDDYATWLGQREEQIADLLALSPRMIDGHPVLKLIVTEAKYITESVLVESQRKSQKQLYDTVARIEKALFGTPGRLDREMWLARVSDLLLEGMEMSPAFQVPLEEWCRLIRLGKVPIDLSGYSHVFISGPNSSTKGGEQHPIAHVSRCLQEVFSHDQVRAFVLAFHKKGPLSVIREQTGTSRLWETSVPEIPAIHAEYLDGTLTLVKETGMGSSTPQQVIADAPAKESAITQSEQSPAVDTPVEVPSDAAEEASGINDGFSDWLARHATAKKEDVEELEWLNETVQALRNALISYDLQAKVLGQQLTPNAAIIRLMGSDRLRIEDIEKRRSQLLTTHALNVISVSGRPGEIVVFVARRKRQAVSLAEVWARRRTNMVAGNNLSLVIGLKEIDGNLLYLNLGSGFEGLQQHAPHTLIAGATGSGKSILLRNLLLDICASNPPESGRIHLIDPKFGVDYFLLEGLPHLGEGVITDQGRAGEVLRSLVDEMERRYLIFRDNRVRDLTSYNASVEDQQRLPVLWVVHDEFAEWMMVDSYRDEISSIVQRLGVKARAAGIHLIFAAQRPDATVMPVQLRDNLGNRLILRVESVGTSEICLAQKGAEQLLGKGHLAARLSGETELIYAQVPFLSDDEAAELVHAIKSRR
jgi:S-DNA-T family DNA segregation ATPase FtsK/SpoIIIE